MFESYLNMQERRGPFGFLLSFVCFSALAMGSYKAAYHGLHGNHHASGLSLFIGIIAGIICYSIILTQAIRRVNAMGRAGILSLLSIIPAANVPLFLIFGSTELLSFPLLIVPIIGVVALIFLLLPSQ